MFENKASYPCLPNRIGLYTRGGGGVIFYNAANKPVKGIGKATMLAFKFATWGENPDNRIDNLLYKGRISVACFKCTFYGYIICKQ